MCKRRLSKPTSLARLNIPLSLPARRRGMGVHPFQSTRWGGWDRHLAPRRSTRCPPEELRARSASAPQRERPALQHVTIADPTPRPQPRPTPKNAHRRWQCSSLGPPAHALERKPMAGKQHNNIPRPTRFMSRAQRHPTPPHRARSEAASPALLGPPTATPTPQAYAHVRRIVLGAWAWRHRGTPTPRPCRQVAPLYSIQCGFLGLAGLHIKMASGHTVKNLKF